jgi:hypothetical protein
MCAIYQRSEPQFRCAAADRWSAFVVCGAVASLIPASITTDNLHTPRMPGGRRDRISLPH